MRRLLAVAVALLLGCGPSATGNSTVATRQPDLRTATLRVATPDPASRPRATAAPVVRVVDGDTLVVRLGGREETVRLIGIDTPESVDPRTPVQCFGREASARAKELLEGKQVQVETDPSQGERDQYGRLLAYVALAGGDLVNQRLIAEGFGHEYTFDRPYRHQAAFRAAERQAREQQRGLWSRATCAGDTNRPADALAPPTSAPPRAPTGTRSAPTVALSRAPTATSEPA